MKVNTLMGITAGKAAHSRHSFKKWDVVQPCLEKIALKFDKDILDTIAKNYEIVVVTGTNGKPHDCFDCRYFA